MNEIGSVMETKLAEDLKKLQVFAAYDFHRMDALVQDLTNALDESTRSKGKNKSGESSRKIKKRNKKRKSQISQMPHWCFGNMSEASESSLDEAIKDYMENIACQSDSDDLLAAARRLPSLTALASHPAIPLAESDSVNENFSPMRPNRRKRRLKRMAVDPHNPNVIDIVDTSDGMPKTGSYDPKDHSLLLSPSGQQTISSCSHSTQDVQLGKRKRSIKDMKDKGCNSFDLDSILDDGGSFNGGEGSQNSSQNMDSNGVSESGTSSLSSNESDGLHTNDESRDGDDEHSDFYHEFGPTCGIPGAVPWWDSSTSSDGPSATVDSSFESILKGSFVHMSKNARRNFKTKLKLLSQPGRPYRSGKRRLKDMKSVYSLSCFLQERQQWNDHFKKLHMAHQVPSGSGSNGNKCYDPKRRRKTPPASDPATVEAVGSKAEPVPESNIGNRMLQSMGWSPGMGLGADGSGITNPVTAYRRPWRMGLGVSCTQSTTTSTASNT